MDRTRRLVIAASMVALASTAVAAPAAAIDPIVQHVAVVQGIPGQKVDVCIDGKEIKSRLKYGGRKFTTLDTGQHKLKAYKKDARKCKGTLLAKKRFTLEVGDDITLVLAKGSPNVIAFFNEPLPAILPGSPQAALVFRHAAKAGAMDMYGQSAAPIVPAFDGNSFEKGDEDFRTTSADRSYAFWATRKGDFTPVAGPEVRSFKTTRRYELILVGSKPRNYRFVVVSRPIILT